MDKKTVFDTEKLLRYVVSQDRVIQSLIGRINDQQRQIGELSKRLNLLDEDLELTMETLHI